MTNELIVTVDVVIIILDLALILAVIRNHLVCNLRIMLVRKIGLEGYWKLPSYDYMLFHFWIPLKKWTGGK